MSKNLTNDETSCEQEVAIYVSRQHLARLTPALDWVERQLTVTSHRFECDGALGYTEHVEQVSNAIPDEGSLVFSAGFVPRLVSSLRAAGLRVRVKRERLRRLTSSSISSDATFRDRERIQAVARHGLSRIEVADNRDARDFCGLIAETFSDAKIMFIVPNAAAAKRLTKLLRALLREKVRLHLTGARAWKARCHVAVANSFPEGRYDLLVLPFLDRCLGQASLDRLAKCHYLAKRILACTIAGKHLDRFREFQCEKIAGPVRCRLGKPHRSGYFALLPTPPCRLHRATTPYGRQRTLYDDNDVRNQFVAVLAEAMSCDAFEVCERLFGGKIQLGKLSAWRLPRVAVLVESAAQARNLARYLPDWRVNVGNPRALHGISTNSTSPRVIVTSYFAARHGIAADVVIRGTGTNSSFVVRGFPGGVGGAAQWDCALVIDFDDRFDPLAAAQSRNRRQFYLGFGFTELPVRPFDPSNWKLAVPAGFVITIPAER